MKIAVLSDIHANSTALAKVLEEIDSLKINKIYILGDMIGYYYHPDEIFELLREYNVEYIQGNHEKIFIKAMEDPQYLAEVNNKYGYGIKISVEKLSAACKDYIKTLPEQRIEEFDGSRILFCHGSINSVEEYIYPDAALDILEKHTNLTYDYIFMGHTHYPFSFSKNNTTLVNVGSVGQARDKGGMASWCIFNTENKTIVFKHTLYDIDGIINEIKAVNPEIKYLYEVLQR